jgi:hypothetical protein
MKSVIELKISQYVSEITILEKGEENKHYSNIVIEKHLMVKDH